MRQCIASICSGQSHPLRLCSRGSSREPLKHPKGMLTQQVVYQALRRLSVIRAPQVVHWVLRICPGCRWFTRYSGWGPGQLQRECASGVWFTAAASSAFILQQGEQDRGASGREMWHQV